MEKGNNGYISDRNRGMENKHKNHMTKIKEARQEHQQTGE